MAAAFVLHPSYLLPMTASQDRPRKGRAEQRQSLLAQARQLFAIQGYAMTTTEQVAAAAGIRPSVANRLYPNRSDLFRDLLEELQTATLRTWRAQTAEVADPYARLQALAERWLEGARTHALAIR